jgi:hypothetical protein
MIKLKILGAIFLFIALCIAVHQYLFWNLWWEWEDIHHEGFIIMFFFAGIILLIIRGK